MRKETWSMRKAVWKDWYPKKEKVIDEDMPLLEKEFRANNVLKILDLGCGTGRHTIYFTERGFEVYGFDFAPEAIKRAKERLRKRGLQAFLKVWNARKKFPYQNEFFDGVLVIRVIHHYPTKIIKKIVKEIERVTKKNGYLYIQVPTLKSAC